LHFLDYCIFLISTTPKQSKLFFPLSQYPPPNFSMSSDTSITESWLTPALTTIFTTPSACSSRLYTLLGAGTDVETNTLLWDLECSRTSDSCYPTASWKASCETAAASFVGRLDYYSPGVCPQDHTVIDTRKYMTGSNTETWAACCPRQLPFLESYREYRLIFPSEYTGTWGGVDCTSTISSTVTVLSIDGTAASADSTYHDLFTNTTTLPAGINRTVLRDQYVVAWQSSDLLLFNPPSAPLSMSASSTSRLRPQDAPTQFGTITGFTSVPTITSDLVSNTSSGDSAASKRTVIGIEIGAVVGFIAVVVLVCVILLRRRLVLCSK